MSSGLWIGLGSLAYLFVGFVVLCIIVYNFGRAPAGFFDAVLVVIWPFVICGWLGICFAWTLEKLCAPAHRFLDRVAKARELSKLPPANSAIHGTLEKSQDILKAAVDITDEKYAELKKQWKDARDKASNLDKKGIRFL